jgi:hypothetical protein
MTLIQKLRRKYRPKKRIKYLLIAESPPVSEDDRVRFFYNPKQKKRDFLFRSVMHVIFLDFETNYRNGDKQKYLQRFKELGFYLIDATDTPINKLTEKEKSKTIESESENKIKAIKRLISKQTPIFLIKKNVFNILYPKLKKLGYNVVHDEFLPFPSSGQQSRFKKKFKKYLTKVYKPQLSGNST